MAPKSLRAAACRERAAAFGGPRAAACRGVPRRAASSIAHAAAMLRSCRSVPRRAAEICGQRAAACRERAAGKAPFVSRAQIRGNVLTSCRLKRELAAAFQESEGHSELHATAVMG